MRIIWRRRAEMEDWIFLLERLLPLMPYAIPMRTVRVVIPQQRRPTP